MNYLYGPMENFPGRIRGKKPSSKYWSVTRNVVMTMRRIVGIIVKNQAFGGKWLLYEAIVDTMRVYIYFSGDEINEFLKVDLDQMV